MPGKLEKIKIPARLRPGDTIGVVAPAGPFDRESFGRGIQILQESGFEVYTPPGLLDAKEYLAGSDRHRARFINRLFADKRINAIICARGGYGSIRILPLLDYQAIGENPKVFIGFSDITVLLNVLTDRSRMVTFHGPMVSTLADAPAATRNILMHAVGSSATIEIKANRGTTIKPGAASGTVCGGNLATLCHLVGTPYAPDFDDKLLFIEDRAEAPYRVDRMLTHMKLAGCFENVAGIALGYFEKCGSLKDIYEIVADTFREASFPILAGLEAGHGYHNQTLPFGIEATLDADNHSLQYHWPATLKTEDKGQRTKDRRQRTDDRGQRTEDRGQRTKDRGQRTDDRGQRTEGRGQRAEGGGQRAEGRGQTTEDRGQRAEVRGRKTDDRWQKTEDRGQMIEDRGRKIEGSGGYLKWEVGMGTWEVGVRPSTSSGETKSECN
ncbi:Muramoyltetrapeptide carboxypeptidase (EC [Olavius algarvensis Delta 1 endosymbiont]|nr:Muramoyltetrapeptide carboxypeptidase (EC [Olavius algarvensis Delta 1 endosymbiont]